MEKDDIKYKRENKIFNYRVAAVINKKDMVLLHRKKGDSFWNLVGGKVKEGESSKNAIIREIKEELSCSVEVKEPVQLIENFFRLNREQWHEILIIYVIDLNEQDILLPTSDELEFKWFFNDEISSVNIIPECLKQIIGEKKLEKWWMLNDER